MTWFPSLSRRPYPSLLESFQDHRLVVLVSCPGKRRDVDAASLLCKTFYSGMMVTCILSFKDVIIKRIGHLMAKLYIPLGMLLFIPNSF